jgi:hypothetical protein
VSRSLTIHKLGFCWEIACVSAASGGSLKRWLTTSDQETDISPARKREGRRGIWQSRFWEHTIESEEDYERHFDYVHYNPVKHGFVNCPHEWAYSIFHRWVKAGVLPWHWACWQADAKTLSFEDIHQSVGE